MKLESVDPVAQAPAGTGCSDGQRAIGARLCHFEAAQADGKWGGKVVKGSSTETRWLEVGY